MADLTNPLLQECPTCGALLDISGEEPFALMHCPTCGAAMRVRRHFDHFEIQEELGAGGMGTVYRALDLNLNRSVALKLLQRENSGNPQYVAQFQKEAATTASINHPHVVRVYSTGQDHGLVYIAMELVGSGSLEGRMAAAGKLPEADVLSVGIQIAEGLQAALDRGLIHRDVKPGNILFADATTAKIVDFGLAILQEHAGRQVDEVWATPYYVSPETLEGAPEDFRADLYSLAASLFHALAGKPPHAVETNSMRALATAKRVPVNLGAVVPAISSATAFAINRALSHEPADRQQSYPQFIEHLQFARDSLLNRGPREAGSLPTAQIRDFRWLTYVAAGITVAAGVAAFDLRQHFRSRGARPEPLKESAPSESGAITYDHARQWLAAGDFARATEAFSALDAVADTPQPGKNWITFHAALADLFAGRPQEAQAHLATLEERGLYSPDPAEQALASFFVDTASRANGSASIPPSAARDLDTRNYEALALLLYGLRDWSLGNYDDAWTLLRQYARITPDSRSTWVADYKSLVSPYLGEVNAYRAALEAVKGADTLESRRRALPAVVEARGRIKLAAPYAKRLDELARDLQDKITAEQEAIARRLAEIAAADALALGDARRRVAAALDQFRPAEALAAMAAAKVTGETARQERESWIKKLTWLTRFKATLINDINTVGYASSLQKKTGALVPGPIRRANETRVEIAIPFGTLSADWTELAPASIIAMAKSYFRPDQPAETLGERRWLLGVYAYFADKQKESRELLTAAVENCPLHRADLVFFEAGAKAE